jgi:hypothetical protein
VPAELAADVGERVVVGLRGGLQGVVEVVRALVERGAVLSPMQEPDLDRSYRSG